MTNFGKIVRDVEREIAEEDRREAPRKERLERLRKSTPRVIYRDDGRSFLGNTRPSYHALRLADARYQPKRIEEFSTFGDSRKRKRTRGPYVSISRSPGGSSTLVPPAALGEYLRRPTSRALRRLEEAEERLLQAKLEVRAATQAAFTYGKPVTVAAVQDVTRQHAAAWKGEDEA